MIQIFKDYYLRRKSAHAREKHTKTGSSFLGAGLSKVNH
jgi:hypothetical protein